MEWNDKWNDKSELPDGSYSISNKWSFPLSISLVNVNKSSGNCGFVHIY